MLYKKKVVSLALVFGIVTLYSAYCLAGNKVENNNSPRYFRELGDDYKEQRKNAEALDAYKRALELNPEMVEAHIGAGRIYARLSKYDEAINEFETAINLNPDSAEAITLLIAVCLYKNNRVKAIDLYKKLEMVSYEGADEVLPMLLQSKYQKPTANEEGISFILGISENMPSEQIRPYLDEAFKLEAEEKIGEAIEVYKKSLTIEETSAAYYYLSQLYLRKYGDFNKAAVYLEKALELEPNNISLIYTLSIVCVALGEEEKAIQRISEAITKEPKNILYLYTKGYIYFSSRKWQEAISAWDELKKYDSESFGIIERRYQRAQSKASMPIPTEKQH